MGHTGVSESGPPSDAGETWTNDTSAKRQLLGVHCPVDADTVYVVGQWGGAYRVTDGAMHEGAWQPTPAEGQALNAVHFPVSGQVGFAVGDCGTIIKTPHGGRMVIDYNEQAICYEAAFEAFWDDSPQAESQYDWFYGFHWWDWAIEPYPKDTSLEWWLDAFAPRQKPAEEVLTGWYYWPTSAPIQGQHYVRHYPTGGLAVVVPGTGRTNTPRLMFGLESQSWDKDPTGNTPADEARLLQEFYGYGSTVQSRDSTGWFDFTADTCWQFCLTDGRYVFKAQYRDFGSDPSPLYTGEYGEGNTFVVFDTTARVTVLE